MCKKMVTPGERIVEVESEDTDATGTASIGDIGESSDISSPGILPSDSGILSHGSSIPSPAHTRSYVKAKKVKGIENLFIKVMEKCIFQET